MLDPITSLLAVCANCNPSAASSGSSSLISAIAVCNAEGRSAQSVRPDASNASCISPPETTADALNLRRVKAAVVNQPQIKAAPSSPEAVVSLSWSNLTGHTVASAAPGSASGNLDRVLQLGSRGQAVSRLQNQLRQLGYAVGAIDGVYGQQTRTAVAQFQRSHSLPADGVVGAKTWAVLQSAGLPRSETPSVPQANPESDRPPAQTPQPPAPIAALAVVPTEAPAQPNQNSDASPQAGFNYLWISGWVIIYGCGWFFILKDTVKEIRGFHAVNQAANEHINGHANGHLNVNAQPVLRASRSSSQDVSEASENPIAEHTLSNHTTSVEHLALLDPWQEEIADAPEILQVMLADDGQIQPLQNVFVVAPRPTYSRRRTKKPTLIYDTKSMRQRIKTG